MGRGPCFSYSRVCWPVPESNKISSQLSDLKVGDLVRFTFQQDTSVIHRAISTYGLEQSDQTDGMLYRVLSIDADKGTSTFGQRAISMISHDHSDPSNHIIGWFITTDGCVRECEHLGITGTIKSVEQIPA